MRQWVGIPITNTPKHSYHYVHRKVPRNRGAVMQQPNEQASTEQPKQLPAHIQEQVEKMRAAGMHVEVITDPSQLKPLLGSAQERELHDMAMQYRAAAYMFLNKWRREAWRFWMSVACNVVLLAWVWVR